MTVMIRKAMEIKVNQGILLFTNTVRLDNKVAIPDQPTAIQVKILKMKSLPPR